jgi:hypothetical protein
MQNLFGRCCSGQNSSACRESNCCEKNQQQLQQQQQVLSNGQSESAAKRSWIKPDVLPLRSPLRSPRTKKIFKRLSDIVIEEEVAEGKKYWHTNDIPCLYSHFVQNIFVLRHFACSHLVYRHFFYIYFVY